MPHDFNEMDFMNLQLNLLKYEVGILVNDNHWCLSYVATAYINS